MRKVKYNQYFLSIIFLLTTATISYADSDGYFCKHKNYIAYEFNGISVSEPGHILRIIFLGGDVGISIPKKIELDRFQTHGMKCNSTSIQIQSWNKVYQIDIYNNLGLKITKTTPISPGQTLLGFETHNLGDWARRKESFELESDDKKYLYELVITKSEKGEEGVIYHKTNTEMLRPTNTRPHLGV